MTVRVSVIPSNQGQNSYRGLPTVTEEKWAMAVAAWTVRRLRERGAVAESFHHAGAVPALNSMIAEAIQWRPTYMLSIHSDAVGDTAQTGVLMLMAREADRYYGIQLGRAVAAGIGLPFKAAWVYGHEARRINYLSALRSYDLEGCLIEVGEHATAVEAAWNWHHIREIGVGIANALADYLGLTEEDDMTDEERKMLKELKLSTVARSYDLPIIRALLAGDMQEAERLATIRDGDLVNQRRRLGL